MSKNSDLQIESKSDHQAYQIVGAVSDSKSKASINQKLKRQESKILELEIENQMLRN